MSARTIGSCGLALVAVACAKSPDVDEPPEGDASEGATADAVIAFTNETGSVQSCTDGLACPPAGSCADHPALGAPDGDTFTLGSSAVLEVAFSCSSILDRAPAAEQGNDAGPSLNDDFRIVATVPDGASATVSVSLDGSTYDVIGPLDGQSQSFDLARVEREVARFVRIAHQLGEPIEIDAIETIR